MYLDHNGSIIYIVRSPTDGKPQSMLEYPQCVCKNNHIYTTWITNQCDVYLDTQNLQTNEGLWRGELCPIVKTKVLSKKDL